MEKNSRKIRRISVVDQVSDSIGDLIRKENLQSGDKLPTETELADMFGVNRFTVRMALQKLITIGIIESRVGEGSFIKQFNIRNYFNQVADIGFSNESMRDIYQLRSLIEGESISLAMENATPEEMAELKSRAEACSICSWVPQDYTFEDIQRRAEIDIAFHQYLCVCSHNKVFEKLYILLEPQLKEFIASFMLTVIETLPSSEKNAVKDKNVHLELYNAIESKDKQVATSIFNKMIYIEQTQGAFLFLQDFTKP